MFQFTETLKQRKCGTAPAGSDASRSISITNSSIRDRHLQRELAELKEFLKEFRGCTLSWNDERKLHEFVLTVKPKEGFWEGGTFKFEIVVPEEYKNVPPAVRCITSIWHPNIDRGGKLCLSVLRANATDGTGWTPVRSMKDVVAGIFLLFGDLKDFDDPLNIEAADEFKTNPAKFLETVESYKRRHVS